MEDLCPCGLENSFENCCEPYIDGKKDAPTAEALMRSRYSAFVVGEIDYIMSTHHPDTVNEVSRDELEAWSEHSDWESLSVLATQNGTEKDSTGIVEFVALYEVDDKAQKHHEQSEFEKIDGKWFFKDGKMVDTTFKRATAKVGRNDPCPCNSGKKYKKCCGR